MKSLFLTLVDWGMGTIIIGIFAVVCVVLVAVIVGLTNSEKKKNNSDSTK